MMVSEDIFEGHCNNDFKRGGCYVDNDNSIKSNCADNFITDNNGIDYRLFTFDDVVLDPSLVGFMAVITKVLSDGNISVLPYAAYSTDHIFVAQKDYHKAKQILEGLSTSLSTTSDEDECM